MMVIKGFIRRHNLLLRFVRFLLRRKDAVFLSWSDVYWLVEEWCKELPDDFDCVIGIPRGGLIVADCVALCKGLPLSDPFLFRLGVVYQSRHIYFDKSKIRNVLIVDDCVDSGSELRYYKSVLEKEFFDVKFSLGSLINHNVGGDYLDYFYLVRGNCIETDLLTKCDGGKLRVPLRLKVDDYV